MSNPTTPRDPINLVAAENRRLKELLSQQVRQKIIDERELLRQELAQAQAHEQKINDQILLIEQERKVSQLHNMSIMSHLSIDPAAMAQASILLSPNNNLDMSAYGGGAIDPSPRISDDRMQIVQWHLSQIESAKEQVEEA